MVNDTYQKLNKIDFFPNLVFRSWFSVGGDAEFIQASKHRSIEILGKPKKLESNSIEV